MAAFGPQARRLIVFLATLGAVALTARLGLWQLDRAAQKQALHEAVKAKESAPALLADELASTGAQVQAQMHRQVRLRGRWLAEQSVYLDNRPMNGRVGFFLVTPLQLTGRGDVILVQRGWIPRDARDRSLLPPVPTAAGEVEVFGRLTPAPSRAYEFSATSEGSIRQNLDPQVLAKALGAPLLPLTVLQLPLANQVASPEDGLLRDWPAQDAGLQKHYGYAFQWFALSALLLGLYVWFQTIRPRLRARSGSEPHDEQA